MARQTGAQVSAPASDDAGPHPVDTHVGSKLKQRRVAVGMTQERLARTIGITFQQVQKYERGTNRIGSSRLYQLGRILEVPVSFFFDDMPSETVASAPTAPEAEAEVFDQEDLSKRETLELVRAYYRINDPAVRKRVFELVKAVGTS